MESQGLTQALRDKFKDTTSALRESLRARIEAWRSAPVPAPQAALLEVPESITLQLGQRSVDGVAAQLRTELWRSACVRRDTASGMVGARMVECFAELSAMELPQEVITDIEKDVRRTMPAYSLFATSAGQQQLRLILRAYAAHDPEVGYCQGMNFVAGNIMLFLPDPAEAFAALVLVMQERSLRTYYVRSMSLLQVQLWQLGKLMSPKLCQHLESCGVVPMLYGASWLMTGFSADFPVSFSARIMDVMLTDQCHCALLKVAVAILRRCERILRGMSDLEAILKYLKVEVPKWSENELGELLASAFSRPWTSRQMTILNNTEDVETVAQGMERVMNLQEQASRAQAEDAEDDDSSLMSRTTTMDDMQLGRGGHAMRMTASCEGGCSSVSAPTLGIPILAPPPSSSSSCLPSVCNSTSSSFTIPASPFLPPCTSGVPQPQLAACRSFDAAGIILSPVPEGGVALPVGVSRLAISGPATGPVLGLSRSGSARQAQHTPGHGLGRSQGHGQGHGQGRSQAHAHVSDPRAWAVPRQPSPLLEDFTRQHPQALATAATRRPGHMHTHGGWVLPPIAHTAPLPPRTYSISMPASRRDSDDWVGPEGLGPGHAGHLPRHVLVSRCTSHNSTDYASAYSGGGSSHAVTRQGSICTPHALEGEDEGGTAFAWHLQPAADSLDPPLSPTPGGSDAAAHVMQSQPSFGARSSPFGRSVQAAAAAVACMGGMSSQALEHYQMEQHQLQGQQVDSLQGHGGWQHAVAAKGISQGSASQGGWQHTAIVGGASPSAASMSDAAYNHVALLPTNAPISSAGSGDYVLVTRTPRESQGGTANPSQGHSPALSPAAATGAGAATWPIRSPWARSSITGEASLPPLQDWTSVEPVHEPDGFDELACSGSFSQQMLQELKRGLEAHVGVSRFNYGGAAADGSCQGSPTSISSTMYTRNSFRSFSPGPAPHGLASHTSYSALDTGGTCSGSLSARRDGGGPALHPAGSLAAPPYEVGYSSATSCWSSMGPAPAAPPALTAVASRRSVGGAFAALDAQAAASGYMTCSSEASYPNSAYSSRGCSVAMRAKDYAALTAAERANVGASGHSVADDAAADLAGDILRAFVAYDSKHAIALDGSEGQQKVARFAETPVKEESTASQTSTPSNPTHPSSHTTPGAMPSASPTSSAAVTRCRLSHAGQEWDERREVLYTQLDSALQLEDEGHARLLGERRIRRSTTGGGGQQSPGSVARCSSLRERRSMEPRRSAEDAEGVSPQASPTDPGAARSAFMRQATLRYVDGIPIFDPKAMLRDSDDGQEGRLGASALQLRTSVTFSEGRVSHTCTLSDTRASHTFSEHMCSPRQAVAAAVAAIAAESMALPAESAATPKQQLNVNPALLIASTTPQESVAAEVAAVVVARAVTGPTEGCSAHKAASQEQLPATPTSPRQATPLPVVAAASNQQQCLRAHAEHPDPAGCAEASGSGLTSQTAAAVDGASAALVDTADTKLGEPACASDADTDVGAAASAVVPAVIVQPIAAPVSGVSADNEQLPLSPVAMLPTAFRTLATWDDAGSAGSSPHTPLVARMELPHGTSVLQLAAAAQAMQAAMDAAKHQEAVVQQSGTAEGSAAVAKPEVIAASVVLQAGSEMAVASAVGVAKDVVMVQPSCPQSPQSPGSTSNGRSFAKSPSVRSPGRASGLRGATAAAVAVGTALHGTSEGVQPGGGSPGADAAAAADAIAGVVGGGGCGTDEQQRAALHLAVAAAEQELDPVALQAALQASCWPGTGAGNGAPGGFCVGSPHTPLVAKMELPRGTSVLQLAAAAAAVQAALDAAAAETAAAGSATGGGAAGTAQRPALQVLCSPPCFQDASLLTPPSGLQSHGGTERSNSLSQAASGELDNATMLEAGNTFCEAPQESVSCSGHGKASRQTVPQNDGMIY